MKLYISRQIFEKCSNIKVYENPSIGSRVIPRGLIDGRTGKTKLVVAFCSFAKAPEMLED
jgi:hypothetical protein